MSNLKSKIAKVESFIFLVSVGITAFLAGTYHTTLKYNEHIDRINRQHLNYIDSVNTNHLKQIELIYSENLKRMKELVKEK
jgi:hypothetical protein